MQNAYFEKTGECVDWHSDLGARLQTVASEILSLYAYGDFVLRQAMAATACGEYLDNHAALRDIRRKTAAQAAGALTFSLAAPKETAVPVAAGTVCSMAGKPFVQFITTEAGTIAAGETAVTVPAEALRTGSEGNAPAGTVTVMVNPPSEVLGVTNEEAFVGGFDEESDEALRRRVLASYRICQTGFSADSVREQLLQLDDVTDCRVQFGDGEYRICVLPKNKPLTPALEAAIRSRLAVTAVTDYPVTVTGCTVRSFDLVLNLHLKVADDAAADEARERVKALCRTLTIGESLSLSRIAYALADMDSVRYGEAASSAAIDGTVWCSDDEVLALGAVEVNGYDGLE